MCNSVLTCLKYDTNMKYNIECNYGDIGCLCSFTCRQDTVDHTYQWFEEAINNNGSTDAAMCKKAESIRIIDKEKECANKNDIGIEYGQYFWISNNIYPSIISHSSCI